MSDNNRDLELLFMANTPMVMIGLPGIGKTLRVNALFKKHKVVSYTLIASNRDPSDLGGMPMKGDGCFTFEPPSFAKMLVDAGKSGHRTALFLDELNQAPPAVQAVAMSVIEEGRVGDLKLPDDCWRVGAMNPTDIATNGYELAAPVANRLAHIEVGLDQNDFLLNFPTYWGDPPKLPTIKEEQWAPWRGNVAAFLYTRRGKILEFPKEVQHQSGPWPSPRTWDKSSRVLAVANSPEDGSRAVGALVGMGLASEFVTFMRNLDLPDSEKVLANPDIFKMEKYKGRGDQVFAILSSLHQAVTSKIDANRYQAIWNVLGKVADAGVIDIGAVWARTIAKMYQAGWKVPAEVNKYSKILAESRVVHGGGA
jgi:hypothetical protein